MSEFVSTIVNGSIKEATSRNGYAKDREKQRIVATK